MSAEILRGAAAELRRLIAETTPGRWKLWGMTVMADQDGTSNYDTAAEVAQTYYRDKHGKPRTWDADYIALMHPPVGSAIADWLDKESDYAEVRGIVAPAALAVANTILRSGHPMTHHHTHLDAVLSRAEVGALLMAGVVVLAVICVAACMPPIYAAIVRRGR